MDIGWILIACAVAMVLSFIFAYPVQKIALRYGFMDIPRDDRRMHTKPTPRLGGLAIFAAFVVAIVILAIFRSELIPLILPYTLGGIIVFTVGILDDKYNLKPWMKLVGQALAGVVLCVFGITVETISLFGFNLQLGLFSYPLTVIWVIAVTNIYNLIDGLDGLCCGLSLLSAACLALLAYFDGSVAVTEAAVVLVFACLGFLPHNTYRAKMFLGDAGAMFCGFMLAAFATSAVYSAINPMPAFIPIVVFGIPVFDATFAIIRRIASKRSIFLGDKGHVHHRLSERYGHLRAVILMHVATVVLIGIALISIASPICEFIGFGLMLMVLAYAIVRFGVYKK